MRKRQRAWLFAAVLSMLPATAWSQAGGEDPYAASQDSAPDGGAPGSDQRLSDLEVKYEDAMRRIEALEAKAGKADASAARDREVESLRAEVASMHKEMDAVRAEQARQRETRKEAVALHGYTDVDFSYAFGNRDAALSPGHGFYGVVPDNPRFYVGHLNLSIDAAIREDLEALAEVRFLYAPNGAFTPYAASGDLRGDTTMLDWDNSGSILHWGGVAIEQAWIRYQPFEFFGVLAGSFYTPYGLLNLDHDPTRLLYVERPFLMQEELFPERQTGIAFHGSMVMGGPELLYDLTLSNGRGSYDTILNVDGNFGLGARLALRQEIGGFFYQAGASCYMGEYTATTTFLNPDLGENGLYDTDIKAQYDEWSAGGDLELRYIGIQLDLVGLVNTITWTDGHRASARGDLLARLDPDHYVYGYYVALSYRLPWLPITPFVYFSNVDPNDLRDADDLNFIVGGLSYRPITPLALKLEFGSVFFKDSYHGRFLGEDMNVIQTQVAVSF